MSEIAPPERKLLMEVEAILQFLIKSEAANDQNADVIVPALAKSAKQKLHLVISTLPD